MPAGSEILHIVALVQNDKYFAGKLREIRTAKGLSQQTVYLDADIHIARVEMRKYNITISTLSDLCDYYGITILDFFEDMDIE